jgi:orotate phosphoribosyltransferase
VSSPRDQLIEHISTEAVFHGSFTLTSGKQASYYIDLRKVSLDYRVAPLIGQVMVELIAEVPDVFAVGGLTMGADPIASAVSLTSFLQEAPGIPAFYVRKEPKGHGTGQWIEGRKSLPAGTQVAVVEDVVTTGASTLKAVERIKAEGLVPLGVVALVDRQEGGREAVEAQGIAMRSLFTRSDFP